MTYDSDHRRVQAYSGKNNPDKIYLTANQVRRRYGGITSMTLYRWLKRKKMRFPKPVYINRLRYWELAKLEAWDRTRACADEAMFEDDDHLAEATAKCALSDDP